MPADPEVPGAADKPDKPGRPADSEKPKKPGRPDGPGSDAPAGPHAPDTAGTEGLLPNSVALLDKAHANGLGLSNGTQFASVPDHPNGKAIDVTNGGAPTPEMQEYADAMRREAADGNPNDVRIIIYNGQQAMAPDFAWKPLNIPPGGWSGDPATDRHEDHVHVATN